MVMLLHESRQTRVSPMYHSQNNIMNFELCLENNMAAGLGLTVVRLLSSISLPKSMKNYTKKKEKETKEKKRRKIRKRSNVISHPINRSLDAIRFTTTTTGLVLLYAAKPLILFVPPPIPGEISFYLNTISFTQIKRNTDKWRMMRVVVCKNIIKLVGK